MFLAYTAAHCQRCVENTDFKQNLPVADWSINTVVPPLEISSHLRLTSDWSSGAWCESLLSEPAWDFMVSLTHTDRDRLTDRQALFL